MVTKTIVNHINPKQTKKKRKQKTPTPIRIGYITYLINYQCQHNHALFSVRHTANTESQKIKKTISVMAVCLYKR